MVSYPMAFDITFMELIGLIPQGGCTQAGLRALILGHAKRKCQGHQPSVTFWQNDLPWALGQLVSIRWLVLTRATPSSSLMYSPNQDNVTVTSKKGLWVSVLTSYANNTPPPPP